MNLILVFFLFLGLAVFEVPKLIKKKYWKELVVYSFFMFVGLVISLLLVSGVNIPPVSTSISNFIKDIFKLKMQ